MGITGIIHLGFTGRQHRAFQFRTGTGGTRQTRPAPYRLPDIRRTRQHGRRNDLLLYGTSGQNKLDREIFQGKERKGRQNGEIPARERGIDGILHFSSCHWRGDRHCTGIYAKQHMAYYCFHVCRQTDTLYPSPVCARKCLGCYGGVEVFFKY